MRVAGCKIQYVSFNTDTYQPMFYSKNIDEECNSQHHGRYDPENTPDIAYEVYDTKDIVPKVKSNNVIVRILRRISFYYNITVLKLDYIFF